MGFEENSHSFIRYVFRNCRHEMQFSTHMVNVKLKFTILSIDISSSFTLLYFSTVKFETFILYRTVELVIKWCLHLRKEL